MKNEINIFFTALMFYTRIPCPSWLEHSEENINKATRYFPLMGWIVGTGSALVVWANHYIFPNSVCILLSLATSILMTGAFHEDGFADVCDGFGGGWTKEKILEIMKDSRVGAYGAIGLIVLLLLKVVVLIELLNVEVWYCLQAMVLAHVISRFSAVTVMFTLPYSRADASSKIKPIAKKLTRKNYFISALWVLLALVLFQTGWIYAVLLPVYLMTMYLARYFKKWIDGYTGDCLGATQQVTEIVALLFCLGLVKVV
ncbi:MAG: adenosylcobinamide-GDP ribazoletransferase [Flammeovirgaceae bacterium]